MANKLKEIFSDELFDMGGKIRFQDHESYKKFLEALQIVQDEGRAVEVDGVSELTTEIKDGGMEYPFIKHNNITQFVVYPPIEDVPITLNTEYGKKEIKFRRYQNTKEIIFETDKHEIVYFKMVFTKTSDNDTFNLTYKLQPQNAKSIQAIVEGYNAALVFLNKMYKIKDSKQMPEGNTLLHDIKKSLEKLELFFKKVYLVEQELGIFFKPTQVNDVIYDKMGLVEIYLLIVEKKAIRLNAKLNADETTEITIRSGAPELKVGSVLDVTFIRDLGYRVFGEKIIIHTANLLSNAIIKEIRDEKEGSVKVMYCDTDSRPMYISYTGFKTVSEAKQETETIMGHKEIYTTALTVDEYTKKLCAI